MAWALIEHEGGFLMSSPFIETLKKRSFIRTWSTSHPMASITLWDLNVNWMMNQSPQASDQWCSYWWVLSPRFDPSYTHCATYKLYLPRYHLIGIHSSRKSVTWTPPQKKEKKKKHPSVRNESILKNWRMCMSFLRMKPWSFIRWINPNPCVQMTIAWSTSGSTRGPRGKGTVHVAQCHFGGHGLGGAPIAEFQPTFS